MKNDVWFKPGDKVMRVGSECSPDPKKHVPCLASGSPKFGVIYCVESFYEGPEFNAVMLCGFGGFVYNLKGEPVGWRATNFRKVEEIRLCIQAASHIKKPDEILEPANQPAKGETKGTM